MSNSNKVIDNLLTIIATAIVNKSVNGARLCREIYEAGACEYVDCSECPFDPDDNLAAVKSALAEIVDKNNENGVQL